MDEGYIFDNVLIANDPAVAAAKREELWAPKKEAEARAALPLLPSPRHFVCMSVCPALSS